LYSAARRRGAALDRLLSWLPRPAIVTLYGAPASLNRSWGARRGRIVQAVQENSDGETLDALPDVPRSCHHHPTLRLQHSPSPRLSEFLRTYAQKLELRGVSGMSLTRRPAPLDRTSFTRSSGDRMTNFSAVQVLIRGCTPRDINLFSAISLPPLWPRHGVHPENETAKGPELSPAEPTAE